MNKATNKPKGTAFVEFKDPASAAKAAKASADARCVAEGWSQYLTSLGLSRPLRCCAMHVQMQLPQAFLCQAACMHSWCRPKGAAGALQNMPSCGTPTVLCSPALETSVCSPVAALPHACHVQELTQ